MTKGAGARAAKRVERKATEAACKLLLVAYDQAVTIWKTEKTSLKASGGKIKVKNLLKKPKKPLKSKPVGRQWRADGEIQVLTVDPDSGP